MSIFLLRHGQTDWNIIDRLQGHTDISLNETGKNMIEEVANSFKSHLGDIDYIISSPLSRAYESAVIFSNTIGYKKEIIVNELFIERCFGLAEGLLQEEIKIKFPDFDVPKMETEKEVFIRAMEGLNYYHSIYSDSNILIVTHGALLKTLVDNKKICEVKEKKLAYAAPGELLKMDFRNGGYTIQEVKHFAMKV